MSRQIVIIINDRVLHRMLSTCIRIFISNICQFLLLQILMSNHAVAIRSPSIGSSNRLLEAQLKMLAREQEKIGNRLISASIQEIQIHVNKLPITTNFQTTIINSLANKGLSDVSRKAMSVAIAIEIQL